MFELIRSVESINMDQYVVHVADIRCHLFHNGFFLFSSLISRNKAVLSNLIAVKPGASH